MQETLSLTRHAVEAGCRAAMILPPFFFVNATDEGLCRYFSQLIERVGSDDLRVCLYHIPQMTGIGISPALAARLNKAFPGIVVAYKDSSGDWENTLAVIRAAPGISVFPGSESFMLRAMRLGGGGCISASCNSNAAAIRAMYDLAAQGRFGRGRGASGGDRAPPHCGAGGGADPGAEGAEGASDRRQALADPAPAAGRCGPGGRAGAGKNAGVRGCMAAPKRCGQPRPPACPFGGASL